MEAKKSSEQSLAATIQLSELTRNSPAEVRNKVNEFLNGIDPAYLWTDRRMAFTLKQNKSFHSYFLEINGEIASAYEYAVNYNGLAIMYRMRTNPEVSKKYFQNNGETLGDAMFRHFLENAQNQGADEAYAEVTEAGYRLIKRAGNKNAVTFTEDKQPSSRMGDSSLVRFKLPKN